MVGIGQFPLLGGDGFWWHHKSLCVLFFVAYLFVLCSVTIHFGYLFIFNLSALSETTLYEITASSLNFP